MLRLILATSLTDSAAALSIAAVTFSEPAKASAAFSLAVEAWRLTNSRAASGTSMPWKFLNASVIGANASFTLANRELVSVVIGVSPSSRLSSYGLTPSGFGPGQAPYDIVNGATQQLYCIAASRDSDNSKPGKPSQPAAQPSGIQG